MTKPYGSPSDLACAAALRLGAIKRDGCAWKFKRRLFSNETAKRALERGIAVRQGDELRASS